MEMHPEQNTFIIAAPSSKGAPSVKRRDDIWEQMRRGSEAVDASVAEVSLLARHCMFAWVKDKAQLVLAALRGEINIAVTSFSFSFPCISLSSLPFLLTSCSRNDQSAEAACRCKIFTQCWLKTKAIIFISMMSTNQTKQKIANRSEGTLPLSPLGTPPEHRLVRGGLCLLRPT